MSGNPHIYTAPDGRTAPCWCNESVDHGLESVPQRRARRQVQADSGGLLGHERGNNRPEES